MHIWKRQILPWTLIAALLAVLLPQARAGSGTDKRVLVLHSYNQGYPWTDNIMEGIAHVLTGPGTRKLDVSVEYMDTKRASPDTVFPLLRGLYETKYAANPPDVIISSDDNAADFLIKYRDELFVGVPVVFCGLNDYDDDRLAGMRGVTGVSESWDPEGTLDLGLALHPGTKTVAVVSDSTASGAFNLRRLKKILPKFDGRADFRFLSNMTASELTDALGKLGTDTIIMNLGFLRDREGRVFTVKEGNRIVSDASGLPVYTSWGFAVRGGVLGGLVVSGYQQGVEAARMALDILGGTPVEDIPVMYASPNVPMFDHNVMVHFNITRSKIPPESRILNEPPSLLGTYRRHIQAAGLVLLILAGMVVAMGLNIIRRRKAERSLKKSEERYALVVRGANDGIWDVDVSSGRAYYSARFKSMLGYADEEFPNDLGEWIKHIHPEDQEPARESYRRFSEGREDNFSLEYRMRHKDGSCRWVLSRGTALRDDSGKPCRLAGTLTDITQNKIMENKLLHMAMHDSLTGLPNRALATDRIGRAMERGKRRNGYHFAVLFIDLDRFKVVNDSLGHSAGDKLLVEVAVRLGRCVRSLDTVSRYGGDEFVVLLEEVDSLRMPVKVVRRIRNALAVPFLLNEKRISVSASIGIVNWPVPATGPADILQGADIAMHRAKDRGRNRFKVFTPRLKDLALARMALENDMAQGISRGEFFLLYQPIVHVDDEHRIHGFEALVRWNHPERGLIPPNEFIPLAEESGGIADLGLWILREACVAMATLNALPGAAGKYVMSVNVSAKQLDNTDFPARLRRTLAETGLPPDRLNLELTETAIMETGMAMSGRLAELKATGVALSIDDFGTGYSSMAYLSRFPLNHLKIDLSFVQSMDVHPENREIVKTIVGLAHTLGLKVVAEGVEERNHLELLSKFECDYFQGYLCSRPIPLDMVKEMARTGRPFSG